MSDSIHLADWLDLARSLEPESIDLVYADPPFNTGETQNGRGGSYADAFPSTAAYVDWLRDRIAATIPAIRSTGNIILHVDWRTSHRVRVLLDDLLGEDRFVNHLVWWYGLGGSSPRRFARKHDDLLWYCLQPGRYYFDPPLVPATSRRMAGRLKKATDVLAIPSINNMAAERTGYPTQKPLALLELLVRACCPPGGADREGGVVLDPCCGSGTTLVAAARTGRRWIGCDLNVEAVRISRGRLAGLGNETRVGEGRCLPTDAEHSG